MNSELKSVINDFVNSISALLEIKVTKKLVDETVGPLYDKGFEQIEVQFDMNLPKNSKEIAFLKQTTFENIQALNSQMKDKLRKELTDALLNRESVSKISQRLTDVLKMSKNRARMIARTENNRVFNAGRHSAAEKTGYNIKKFVSVRMDDRTSPICERMHRKYGSEEKAIPLKAKFKDSTSGQEFLMTPFHVNCRSRINYV